MVRSQLLPMPAQPPVHYEIAVCNSYDLWMIFRKAANVTAGKWSEGSLPTGVFTAVIEAATY